jgi:protein O-mannosyl-transferase
MNPTTVQPRAPSNRAIFLFLFAVTLVVYARVLSYPFVSFDDDQGLLGNPFVRDGFTWSGIAWAFRFGVTANWFPVTWLSHILDAQLFGLDAGWHHFTNVLIHACNSVLLVALLKRMTARVWESAFVAFVFALHPLHVESVAWISERKDVLFAFFWFLTTWLYLDFLERRTTARYLRMVLAFCLGLMSKQMIVTLPFTLLLLDAWPLKRTGLRTLLLEKVPLLVLSIAGSLIAFLVQNNGGATRSLAIPLAARVANALIAYVVYLADFVWPAGLAVFYPYPREAHPLEALLAALALLAISILTVRSFRRLPYLAVGWFWYLGTLVPVIGLIQVGSQSRADRYTYVPLIGISIMVAWAAADAIGKWPRAKPIVAALAIVACAAWLAVAWIQIHYWQDSITLYRHAIAVTDANYRAHENLGVDLAKQGNYPEAVRELSTSIEENPEQANARNSLGSVLNASGRTGEAIEQFSQAIRLQPGLAQAHSNLGNAFVTAGRIDDAVREFDTALRLNPGVANAYFGLGRVRVQQNRPAEAIPYFSEALRINPNFAQARQQLDALRRRP